MFIYSQQHYIWVLSCVSGYITRFPQDWGKLNRENAALNPLELGDTPVIQTKSICRTPLSHISGCCLGPSAMLPSGHQTWLAGKWMENGPFVLIGDFPMNISIQFSWRIFQPCLITKGYQQISVVRDSGTLFLYTNISQF